MTKLELIELQDKVYKIALINVLTSNPYAINEDYDVVLNSGNFNVRFDESYSSKVLFEEIYVDNEELTKKLEIAKNQAEEEIERRRLKSLKNAEDLEYKMYLKLHEKYGEDTTNSNS